MGAWSIIVPRLEPLNVEFDNDVIGLIDWDTDARPLIRLRVTCSCLYMACDLVNVQTWGLWFRNLDAELRDIQNGHDESLRAGGWWPDSD